MGNIVPYHVDSTLKNPEITRRVHVEVLLLCQLEDIDLCLLVDCFTVLFKRRYGVGTTRIRDPGSKLRFLLVVVACWYTCTTAYAKNGTRFHP